MPILILKIHQNTIIRNTSLRFEEQSLEINKITTLGKKKGLNDQSLSSLY
jgi:hypothetical protein